MLEAGYRKLNPTNGKERVAPLSTYEYVASRSARSNAYSNVAFVISIRVSDRGSRLPRISCSGATSGSACWYPGRFATLNPSISLL